MESKDDRSKLKRQKMKGQKLNYARKKRDTIPGNTSSSSAHADTVRSVVDVADSSDEQRFGRHKGWVGGGKIKPQHNKKLLDKHCTTAGDLDDDEDFNLRTVENAQIRAGDFSVMAQMPSIGGGHFFFSSEKEWETADNGGSLLENTEANKYFSLNLKLINAGLNSIPFYKRMDYPASLFTREQQQKMDDAAEVAEKLYQNLLKEQHKDAHNKLNSASQRTQSAKSKSKDKPDIDELDDILNNTTMQVANVTLDNVAIDDVPMSLPAPAPSPAPAVVTDDTVSDCKPKTDIEQWLDDVLEE